MVEESRLRPLRAVSVQEIAAATDGVVFGGDASVTGVRPLSRLARGALSFANGPLDGIDPDAGAVVLVRRGRSRADRNVYIEVDNPRLAFATALARFFAAQPAAHVAASARVSPEARIAGGVWIGEHVVIEADVTIGARTRIQHGAVVHSGTVIGEDCVIGANAVVGTAGFGYERDAAGVPHFIAHLGGVRIGRDVHLGASSTVARGTLDETVIGDHTKIGVQTNIQHNVVIGPSCLVTGQVQISGSVQIGERCWIGPNCTIRQSVRIGDRATIGLGVLVLEDVPGGVSVVGEAARRLGGPAVTGGVDAAPALGGKAPAPSSDAAAITAAFEGLVRDILKLPAERRLSDDLAPADVATWDSLANVNLLIETQSRFGVTFDVEAMAAIRSIGDLRAALRDHLAAKGANAS